MFGGVDNVGNLNNFTYVFEQRGYDVSFQVDDPTFQPYFIMTNTTNNEGNASVSFTLAMDAPEGIYNCTATANVSGDILLAETSFQVVWPWSPVLNTSYLFSANYSYPGDLINLSAYAGYEYLPANKNKSASGINLSADVLDLNSSVLLNITKPTNVTGWADLSFMVPNITASGLYNVSIHGFGNTSKSVQFYARPAPLPPPPFGRIVFKSLVVPPSVNRGGVAAFQVFINNSFNSSVSCLLVVQILDSNNVPFRPDIQMLNVTVGPDFLVTVNITIDQIRPTGSYVVQFQLLTGLPKNHGYALDFKNELMTVA
jgi:hypothetical protein